MSEFDDGMAMADDAAFSVFADEDNVLLWHGELPPVSTTGIVMPVAAGSVWQAGGRMERGSVEVEIPNTVFRANGVKEGWRLRVDEKDYRVNEYIVQGSTVTLLCGPVADGSVR